MKVQIGHLAKTLNSTEFRFDSLSDIETLTLELVLKEPTSKYSPTFMLVNTKEDEDKKTVPKYFEGYNYMYVPKWGYYTIDSITYETHGIISFHCTRDVLATGHDYIKFGYMYLKYCSSVKDTINPRLGLLDDDRFGPDLFAGVSVFDFAKIGSPGHLGNSFWGIRNGPSAAMDYYTYKPSEATVALTTNSLGSGAVTFFMSIDDFGKAMTAMNTFASGISAMDDLAQKYVFGINWRECFLAAKMLPINLKYFEEILSDKHTLAAGAEDDILNGSEFVYTKSPQMFFGRRNKLNIDFIPMLENQMYRWLRGPKYTSICFEYPGGSIDLSSDAFMDNDTVVFVESLNLVNGDYCIKFYLDNDGEQAETKENGTCLGAARMDLSLDLFDMLTHIDPTSNIQAILNKTMSASAAVATTALGVHLGQQGAINAANTAYHMGQVQYQRMQSQATTPSGRAAAEAFRENTLMQRDSAVERATRNAHSEMLQMGTGILGQYTSTNAVPAKSSYSLGGGLVPFYEAWEAGADAWKARQCRLVVTTNVPAIFYADSQKVDGSPVVDENTPIGDTIYAKFGGQYGFPIYRYIDFADTEKIDLEDLGSKLITAIGADCGFSGYLYGREPEGMKFTLSKSELSELNTQLNTNGVYLSAITDENWGKDIDD